MSGNSVQAQQCDSFEETVLPHLDAAYTLALWLARNEPDARDVVQESFLRALRSFAGFQPGRDCRAWLLTIVRHTFYDWLRENRKSATETQLDDNSEGTKCERPDPEASLIESSNAEYVREAIGRLTIEYREVLILRELEGLSYKQIAEVVDVPVGTVMSRLSRARKELHARLSADTQSLSAGTHQER